MTRMLLDGEVCRFICDKTRGRWEVSRFISDKTHGRWEVCRFISDKTCGRWECLGLLVTRHLVDGRFVGLVSWLIMLWSSSIFRELQQ